MMFFKAYVFNFEQFQYIYFCIAYTFAITSKKALPNPELQGFIPVFSSEIYIVLVLTFMPTSLNLCVRMCFEVWLLQYILCR